MNRFCLLLFLILTFYPILLKGQSLNVKKLRIEHNLSNNFVRGIVQDENGFIWVATGSGLNRFDGKTFKVYKKKSETENSLGGNELNKILHHNNTIWIATQHSGLNAYDCNTMTFTHYVNDENNPESIMDNDITDLILNKDENIWVATYHAGFDLFDRKTEKFIHFNTGNVSGMASDRILSIAENAQGNVYVGHESHGFSIVDIKNRTAQNFSHNANIPNSLPGNEIQAIQIDDNGYVWLGTNNGLSMFNPDNQTFVTFKHNPSNPNSLLSSYINSLFISSDNKLWVGSVFGGVSVLDLKRTVFTSSSDAFFYNIECKDNEEGLSNPNATCIFEDSYHNIWVGTYGGGINFISNLGNYFNQWRYSPILGSTNSLSAPIASTICIDQEDKVWVGTNGGGIDLFSNGKKIKNFSTPQENLISNTVLASLTDKEGNLWFGGYDGRLYVYNQESQKNRRILLDKSSKLNVRCLYEGNNDIIWIGSTEGLFYYDKTNETNKAIHIKNNGLQDINVRSIVQDKNNNLWIGTSGNGIEIYDCDQKQLRIVNSANGLYSNSINHLFVSSDSTIWAATNEGLVQFIGSDLSQLHIYLEKDGLPDNTIKAITQDKNGNIWLSSNVGISKFEPLLNHFYNYNHLDGVPLGTFMGGSVAQSKNGTIYLGSQNGVCYFNPMVTPDEVNLSPTVITEFLILDRQSSTTEKPIERTIESKINLTYKQNSFKISFNELNYALNEKVEFAYRLIGLDNSWYDLHDEKSVIFRNLSPGHYKFEVKSRLRNSEWPDNTISILTIEIKPPFWLSWWAKSIYAAGIILIIILIIHFYKRKLKIKNTLYLDKQNLKKEQELNNEKLRFYTNVTHELRTPLTLILGPLNDILADSSLPEKFSSRIKIVVQSASKLLELVNQILEFRKIDTNKKHLCVSKDNISLLLTEIAGKYRSYIENKGIRFIVESEGDIILYFDAEVITTIVNNLLSNAIKYTKEGNISLKIHTIEEDGIQYVEIEVSDTGIGIPEEAIPRIFERYYQAHDNYTSSGTGIGLALVQSLSQLHDAHISVSTLPNQGSTFKIRLKLSNTYPDAIHIGAVHETHNAPDSEETTDDNKNLILVIEDNAEILEYISDILSEKYRVRTASDGISGVNEAFSLIPDIIISDIMMPNKDGIELCKELKEDIRTSHIPIILLTAKDSLQDKTLGYSIGADSYITKPFTSKLLMSRISNLLEMRQKISEQISYNTPNKRDEYIESLSDRDNEFLKKVTDMIHEHIDSEKIDVVFLADQMNMSHSSFYRKIKALTGMTASEYIRKVKIRIAEQFLLTGKYTISEVAYAIGMNSTTYFRESFKNEFGMSPSEYLKRLQRNK